MYEIRKEGVETKPLSLYYVNMEDFPIDDQTFTLYCTLIDKVSGIHFSSGNRVVFESKLKEILRNRKMLPMEYYRCLLSDPEEVKLFLDALTTNLTSFFRNRSNWESLQHEIIPDLMKSVGKSREIRIWSAGCSTGEEAYTLAMVFDRTLLPGYTYKIIACDISLKSLHTAAEGWYPFEKAEKDVPSGFLEEYFDREEKGYRVKPQIKEHIVFNYHNLMNPMHSGYFDLIVCRNVLIYFDKESFFKVIRQFYNDSLPHSYLILGHSETLFNLNTGFHLKKGRYGCYYVKEGI